jgi:hypothetical protein
MPTDVESPRWTTPVHWVGGGGAVVVVVVSTTGTAVVGAIDVDVSSASDGPGEAAGSVADVTSALWDAPAQPVGTRMRAVMQRTRCRITAYILPRVIGAAGRLRSTRCFDKGFVALTRSVAVRAAFVLPIE